MSAEGDDWTGVVETESYHRGRLGGERVRRREIGEFEEEHGKKNEKVQLECMR